MGPRQRRNIIGWRAARGGRRTKSRRPCNPQDMARYASFLSRARGDTSRRPTGNLWNCWLLPPTIQAYPTSRYGKFGGSRKLTVPCHLTVAHRYQTFQPLAITLAVAAIPPHSPFDGVFSELALKGSSMHVQASGGCRNVAVVFFQNRLNLLPLQSADR